MRTNRAPWRHRWFSNGVGDDEILVSWHAPNMPPEGETHGAEGVCVTDTADVVISRDGRRWELPAGRPERGETWEQTLRR